MASCFLILRLGVEMSSHAEYWTVLHSVSSAFRDVEFFQSSHIDVTGSSQEEPSTSDKE